MADKSITGLTAAGTITGDELIKVVQGGNSRKVSLTTVIAALAAVGVDGEDGRTILNGMGVPSGGTGVDGDFYLRTSNYVLYGPKTAGAWGSGVSLVGPAGADGADGADGLDGTDGDDGRTVLNGTGAPSGGLGNDGDFYLNTSNYDMYGPKTAGAWGTPTSLLGTIGSDGTDGVDGRTILYGTAAPTTEGQDGDFYIRTTTNFIYGPKTAGVWPAGTSLVGPAGTNGADGTDGTDGNTILYGTAAPTTEGNNGDFYIRTTTNFIYGPKAGGVWPSGTSLVGAAGTNGTNGTNGNTVLYGTAAPTTEGNNGDFYIRTTTNFIYGPKAGGVWPSGTSLIGPSGTNGTNGNTILNGTSTPPSSGLGADGDFYLNTTTRVLYGPKASGAWPSGVPLSGLESFIIGASDETTALTAGTTKVTFRMPYAFTLTAVRASLTTAQASGSIFTVDINEGGTTILSTKLTIDNTEKTSTTAATAPVISDTSLADDAEITVDIDQVGDGTAKGLKVTLIGYRIP